jgi:uncharacterized MAPEG superfamily protein
MTRPLLCLAAFAGWAVLLVTAIGASRVFQVMTGRKKSNEFPSGTQHGGDVYWRLNRAHVNTVENLPIFGALVICGVLLRVDSSLFQTLPLVVIGARVVQSLVHISSGSVTAVNVRFTAFLTQATCFALLLFSIVRSAQW